MSASVKDVARLAGVSASTVSNFLNRPDVVSEPTRIRIAEAVRQLGFVPNEAARLLRSGQGRTLALVLLDAWAPYFAELSRGVEDAATTEGWAVLFSNSARDPDREARNLRMLESQRVQGVVVAPQGDVASQLRSMQARGTACVTVGHPVLGDDIASVTLDDVLGGRLAGQHLLETGATDLIFVGNPDEVLHSRARLTGFLEAVAHSHVSAHVTCVDTRGLSMRDGGCAAEHVLALPPARERRAVFAANDLLALGAMQVFHRAGLRVPEDIALVGYDDIEYAREAAVPLTTVRQPAHEMGAASVQLLLGQLRGTGNTPRHRVFEPSLVVRDSAPSSRSRC